MWEVFAIRVIKRALTGKKEKHADIANQLGLGNAKRSSHLLESGLQKFKAFANRIIKEAEPGADRRSPEELLKVLAKPPIPNFDLCKHLKNLVELSAEGNEVFLIKTSEELQMAAELWLNDREVESRDENELRWSHILSQTVAEYQEGGQITASMSVSFSGLMSGTDETLSDVLFQPTSKANSLRDIRVASRKSLARCDSPLESSMHRTIYALVHASDIIHHKTCQSKSGPESLKSIFKSSLTKPWLDEQSRWQLNAATKALVEEQIPFPRQAPME